MSPFVLVGRHERSCLRLEDAEVSRRHAYLQQLGGRVFCVDLGSRTGIRWGGKSRLAGWLRPEQGVQIGPFNLELARTAQVGGGPEEGVAEDWDPLQDRANDSQHLPRVTVELDNEVVVRLSLNRMLVLVGSSPACRVRLRDGRVSKYHCSLVRTPQGVWLIDLHNGTGTYLNGQSLPWALVKEGDCVRVGPYMLRVWYQDQRTETPSRNLLEIPVETPEQPAPQDQDQRDAEMLRQQLEDSQAECNRLREETRLLQDQIARMADLQAQLEAAKVSAGELEVVRGERDRWQAETRTLQARLASELAEREELRQWLEATQQQLEGEREAFCVANAHLEQECASLQTVRADLASRNTEHDAAVQQLQEIQDKLAHAQDETRGLQTELDQALERQRDVDILKQNLTDSQAENVRFRAHVSELEERANSIDRLQVQLQDAGAESERLRVQLRAVESRAAELEGVLAECDRLREQTRVLEGQVGKMADLQAQLEAAEARASELEVVRGERDRWQAETQTLQARLASELAEREQLSRLAEDLHAAQAELDRLQAEEQTSRHSAEQASIRVADLEHMLAETATAQTTSLEEARRLSGSRNGKPWRLALSWNTRTTREQSRPRFAISWPSPPPSERNGGIGSKAPRCNSSGSGEMFQERSEHLRRQAANLQAERDRLAARLAQMELHSRATAEPSPD